MLQTISLLFVFSCFANKLVAQDLPPNVCKIENGNLVFTIDLNWNEHQKEELRFTYSLDSLLIAKIFEGQKEIYTDSTLWVVNDLNKHMVTLSKSLEESIVTKDFLSKLIAEAIEGGKPAKSGWNRKEASFGTNKVRNNAISVTKENKVKFFLPKHNKAISVYLSGTFNDWSTGQTPMQKTDSGWVHEINLEPGEYAYKYIVDGNWKLDPNNEQEIPNEHGTGNSVFFVPNYTFKLKGFEKAKRIILAGSFNSWNENDFRMKRKDKGWELAAYLKEGTHLYKFIVDGNWMTDPGNNEKRPNEHGTYNSVLGFGEVHLFKLEGFQNAKAIYLAGNFNNWNNNELLMKKTEDGWKYAYHLAPGNYEYKFYVDGKWITDPSNPLQTGSGDYVNSFISFKPNYIFKLKDFKEAKQVMVTGSFNGWSHSGFQMSKVNEKWVLPIYLGKGKHTYKFIVDGEWIIDPTNRFYEENEYGTGNSVLWIE